jgi:GAF domain-containing protein
MSDPRQTDPVLDAERLREVADLGLLGGEHDAELQTIARSAAERLGLPIGLVSIVLSDAQVFAGTHGLGGWLEEANGTPVEWSFCANSVRTGEPFVVEDATTHALVRDNPLVREDGVRCYAGIPLVSSRGLVLGNLCVIGTEERSFGPEEMEILAELAHAAVERIESRAGRR